MPSSTHVPFGPSSGAFGSQLDRQEQLARYQLVGTQEPVDLHRLFCSQEGAGQSAGGGEEVFGLEEVHAAFDQA